MYIKIHFYLIVFSSYLCMVGKIRDFLMFYMFAIIHEMAHILMAEILKVKTKEIVLLPAGVNAKFSENISKKKEILIAISGPIISIIMAFILKNTQFSGMNIFIAILNLIPIYPLDGGRILRRSCEILLGYRRGLIISMNISILMSILTITISTLIVIYLKNYSVIIFIIYLIFIMMENIKKDRIENSIKSMLNLNEL